VSVDGVSKIVRVCKRCNDMHQQFHSTITKQKVLLTDKVSERERLIDSNQFVNLPQSTRNQNALSGEGRKSSVNDDSIFD
jgi:hypothetical protein